jgi:AhpD family alkylhydroperoxidase
MLPKTLRYRLFETLSLKTMRYVHAIPRRKATGLVAEVYNMIEEDFFINGSLTSRSKVPILMVAIWTAGRESVLVDDRLDRTTKEAMNAVLSQINDCPYCGDMLISLVHAGGQHETASNIFAEAEAAITDYVLRTRLAWGQVGREPSGSRCEETFIRILAWASFSSARRFAQHIAERVSGPIRITPRHKKRSRPEADRGSLEGTRASTLTARKVEPRLVLLRP